jgi:hypothetical protein
MPTVSFGFLLVLLAFVSADRPEARTGATRTAVAGATAKNAGAVQVQSGAAPKDPGRQRDRARNRL